MNGVRSMLANRLSKLFKWVIKSCIPRSAFPVICGPLRGARFILGSLSGDGSGSRVYINMVEQIQTAQIAKSLERGMVFLDIGANVGYYSILGAHRVGPTGRVFAMEPLPRNISFLHRHLTINNIQNVTIIPMACFHELSLLNFEVADNTATSHVRKELDKWDCVGKEKIIVAGVSIDLFCKKAGIRPDVIKIDVEGAELDVLSGAAIIIKNKSPKIFLSTHSEQLKQDCFELLAKHGYSFHPLDGGNAAMDFYCTRINNN